MLGSVDVDPSEVADGDAMGASEPARRRLRAGEDDP
jgi:hypothetical protein